MNKDEARMEEAKGKVEELSKEALASVTGGSDDDEIDLRYILACGTMNYYCKRCGFETPHALMKSGKVACRNCGTVYEG